MKLILLIILIIFGFQSSAWGQAPTLSIEAKQEPIQEIMKKIDELYMTSERSFSGTLITDASSMDADQILEEMYSGITNKEKYSKEDLNSIADKGMQIAEIFMKNARETKELFEESLKGL